MPTKKIEMKKTSILITEAVAMVDNAAKIIPKGYRMATYDEVRHECINNEKFREAISKSGNVIVARPEPSPFFPECFIVALKVAIVKN